MSLPAPTVRLVFDHQTPLGCTPTQLRATLQAYATGPVQKLWGLTCRVVTGGTPKSTDWIMAFLDNADVANALGYHDFSDTGMPVSKVFVADAIRFDGHVSVTASHELAEMLVDPAVNLAATLNGYSNKWFQGNDAVAYEVADPVEDQTFALKGLPVSNLVTPEWFEYFHALSTSADRPRYDYLGNLKDPFTLTPGGYMPIFRGNQWTQVFGSKAKAREFAKEDRRGHRSQARVK
jgi:hypothetical protein